MIGHMSASFYYIALSLFLPSLRKPVSHPHPHPHHLHHLTLQSPTLLSCAHVMSRNQLLGWFRSLLPCLGHSMSSALCLTPHITPPPRARSCPQVLSRDQLLGRYGSLLSRLVHLRSFITFDLQLQAAALLALTQLMAVDGAYCSDNVALLFTLLHKRCEGCEGCEGRGASMPETEKRYLLEQGG